MELALPAVVVDLWSRYQQEIWWLSVVSLVTLILSALLIPYLIVKLPADFYAEHHHRRRILQSRPDFSRRGVDDLVAHASNQIEAVT